MNPGFGAAIDLAFQICSSPSLRDIFLTLMRYARRKVVALDLPAKQWIKTLFLGGSPATFSLRHSSKNLFEPSTSCKTFWFGESKAFSRWYLNRSGNLGLIFAAQVRMWVIPCFYSSSLLYAAPIDPRKISSYTAAGTPSSFTNFMAVRAFITSYNFSGATFFLILSASCCFFSSSTYTYVSGICGP